MSLRGRFANTIGALLPVLAALLLAAPARAQDLPVMARLIFDGTALTVGQPAHFTLEVIHPVDTVAILPVLDAAWSSTVEVRSQSAPVTRDNGDGTLTTSQTIEAAIFAPGAFATPPVRTVVSDRSGATVSAVAAPVPVTVDSVLGAADVEPRDIKPQATLSGFWAIASDFSKRSSQNHVLTVAGGLLLLVTGGLIGWFLQWRRGLHRQSHLEAVLHELSIIDAERYPQKEQFKEMYMAVSHAVRLHLEREFGVDLHKCTTREIRSTLRGMPLGKDVPQRLITLFTESDLVKFSEIVPSPISANTLLAEARELSVAITNAHAADAARRAQMQAGAGAPAPARRA